MRIVTVATPGSSPTGFQLGFLLDDVPYSFVRAAAAVGGWPGGVTDQDAADILTFIEGGERVWEGAKQVIERFRALDSAKQAPARLHGTLAAPIPRPRRNIFCLGRNYAEHAAERGAEVPQHPIYFTKAPSCVVATEVTVPYPRATKELDYEGELAVIIGRRGKYIPPEKAYDYVFGYTIANDLTARDLQKRHGQWFKGKSLDSFCPLGPYIATRDELGEARDLRLETRVNGEVRQSASTAEMIFDIPTQISVLSDGITLEPGDIILTGTPAGVGGADGRLLKPGDLVEITITGLGTLRNRIGDPE